MARCLWCNAGNGWIEGNVAKSVPLDETDERIADLQRQLAEAKPIIEAAARGSSVQIAAGSFIDRWREYEARKQP